MEHGCVSAISQDISTNMLQWCYADPTDLANVKLPEPPKTLIGKYWYKTLLLLREGTIKQTPGIWDSIYS